MFKYDWQSLLKNKKMLGTAIVMMFIPVIYAGIILSSFWDPFNQTDHMAVAVVNEDQPADVEGTTLSIGEDLVDELKTNKDFDWHFVSKAEAEKGFDDNDYYMMVVIPENFSSNAATVMDDEPEKMKLNYKINPGRNYFIESISSNAADSLNQSISDRVTESYVKVLFDQISGLGNGLAEAADGSGQLEDGTNTAKDGAAELTKQLAKLTDGTLTFQDGASELNVGLKQFADGVNQLNTGAADLTDGIHQFADGTGALATGAASLQEGTSAYTAGVAQVAEGAGGLSEGTSQLNEKSTSLVSGANDVAAGVNAVDENINRAQQEGSAPLAAGLEEMRQQASALTDRQGLSSLVDGIGELQDGMYQLSEGSSNLTDGLTQMQELSTALSQAIKVGDMEQAAALSDQMAALNQQLLPGAESLENSISGIASSGSDLRAGLSDFANQIPALINGFNQAADGAGALNNSLVQLADGTGTLATGAETLKEGTAAYTQAVEEINNGAAELASGAQALNGKSGELSSGVQQLAEGSTELNQNTGALVDGSDRLASGIGELANNTPALTEGSTALSSGAADLSDGATRLTDGSQDLGEGLSELSSGTAELAAKLLDGAEEAGSVHADDQTYAMMAAPAETSVEKVSDVPNYGHALAPNFLSIGLFIAALAFNMIFPLGQAKILPASGREFWLSKASIAAVQAIMSALILDAIVIYGLGLEIDHIGLFIAISIVSSLAYMFLVTLLVVGLGNPGRFIAMVGLVVQLAASGAMFPRELTAPFFEAINPYLPMTYVIYGFREAIFSAEGMYVYDLSVGILVALVLLCNVLLWHVFSRKADRLEAAHVTVKVN
ncbi:YhgE/Pip family protein [Jeotgalibacillus malaysiensis]|uniref:YhgE/Pip family protein n=1 Tax=Jeotgalibacillus malaysiensis TaxID=1508404 RepID=UPI003850FFE7